jgi:maltooligosyltrehalose trehalohydrolase
VATAAGAAPASGAKASSSASLADAPRRSVTFVYDADGHSGLSNLTLVGSWNTSTHGYDTAWDQSAVPMRQDKDGCWRATVELADDAPHDWQWGVKADGPAGKQQWAIFEESNLHFSLQQPGTPSDEPQVEAYQPSHRTRMGMTHQGEDLSFRYWAPDASKVQVRIFDPAQAPSTTSAAASSSVVAEMVRDARTGMWSTTLPGGWKSLQGKAYAYEVTTTDGQQLERVDPYARNRQGQQRGVAELYLHPITGAEVNRYYVDPALASQGKPSWLPFVRLEVQGHTDADSVSVVFRDDSGRVLDKAALQERLGAGASDLVTKFHDGKLSDFWSDNVTPDGRVALVRQGDAWAAMFDQPELLAGLHYTFEVRRGGDLQGDSNHDGVLQVSEARTLTYNDPYSDRLDDRIGWERYGLIRDDAYVFAHDQVPREAQDRNKMITYQLHVGSFFGNGRNVHRSTFNDVVKQLDYLQDLGVNTLELLPTTTLDTSRDWGYVGTDTFAATEQYGFEDEGGRWVSGTEALKRLVDAAHGRGMAVITDLVFNHWDASFSDLWNSDGTQNPYYNWSPQSNAAPLVKPGQFGALPAYNQPEVVEMVTDSALAQLEELHFDGARFDYTHPIHNDGDGGTPGWEMLRRVNRELHFFHPGTLTNAEEFPNEPVIVTPAGPNLSGGAGFDTMWNTEFQHRLVHRDDGSGLLQQAARGAATNVDQVMSDLTDHPGFPSWHESITIIGDHDEVGNADRTLNIAMDGDDHTLPSAWARNAVRTTFGLGMLAPGAPLFFQGEESLARNHFAWAVSSTWDLGWEWRDLGKSWDWEHVDFGRVLQAVAADPKGSEHWWHLPHFAAKRPQVGPLTPAEQQVVSDLQAAPAQQREAAIFDLMRHLHHDFCKDVIALRKSTPAFDGDAALTRVYTSNQDGVLAYTRSKGGDEYLVVGSFNHSKLSGYSMPLPQGRWQLVLDSDSTRYGGDGGSATLLESQDGRPASLDLGQGGMLVYRRVG